MSDDAFIRQLSQFTPDGAGLDRDALLFAAGKASARANLGWQVLAGALAVTQLVILGFFLMPQAIPPFPASQAISIAPIDIQPSLPPSPGLARYLALREYFSCGDGALLPLEFAEPDLPDEPTPRGFGRVPLDLLN